MSEPLEEYDYELALALQTQYEGGNQANDSDDDLPNMSHLFTPSFSKKQKNSKASSPSMSSHLNHSNIMDPNLEISDPNPDIRMLYLKFNERYFWGKLDMVEVKWSSRMTLCAGICCYEGRGGLCSIRLSQPLLKFRPRKDLVETLLHEMIHAYLFVTQNNKDHDGHGPELHKHMYRINKLSGSNITVYHNFHDEVQAHRTHWWKCNGVCQHRPPYFGIVKRSMNRAPSPRDTWWSHHEQTCGGKYTKIKEPADYQAKKNKKSKSSVDVGSTNKSNNSMAKNVNQECESSKINGMTPSILKFLEDKIEEKKHESPSKSSLKNLTNRTNNRKSFGKSHGKKKIPTSAKQLSNLMRKEGRVSVCVDAPAFKMKTIASYFKKRIVFTEEGDEIQKKIGKSEIKTVDNKSKTDSKIIENRKRQRSDKNNDTPLDQQQIKNHAAMVQDDDSSGDDDITLISLMEDEPVEKKRKFTTFNANDSTAPSNNKIGNTLSNNSTPAVSNSSNIQTKSTVTSNSKDFGRSNDAHTPSEVKKVEHVSCESSTNDSVGSGPTSDFEGGPSVQCPICKDYMSSDMINVHIDSCLTISALQRGDF